uniref:Ppx/GppA phosphatase N-terminal domain-containing protein n=1 Tax=Chlamydomonas leiostraca TaxID=1034604 RepID=A0A7S0RGW7_9CHLO
MQSQSQDHQHAMPHWHCAPSTLQEQLEWEQVLSGKASDAAELQAHQPGPAQAHATHGIDSWDCAVLQPSAFSHAAALPKDAAAWDEAMGGKTEHAASTPLPACAVVIGSHSVMAVVHDGRREVARAYQDSMLGHGLTRGAHLCTGAVASTAHALSHVAAAWHQTAGGVPPQVAATRVQAVGTAALRECADAAPVAHAVQRLLGAELRVISASEEGRLSFAGATAGLPAGQLCVLIDMGGRSSEVAVGVAGPSLEVQVASIPLGCSTFQHDPFASAADTLASCKQQAQAIVAAHRDVLDSLLSQHPKARGDAGVFVMVTGGTATTAAALLAGLAEYDRRRVHHAELGPLSCLEELAEQLLMSGTLTEAGTQPSGTTRGAGNWPVWLTASRAASMPAGCIVLVELARAVCGAVGEDERHVLVSDRDLLDALLDGLLSMRARHS